MRKKTFNLPIIIMLSILLVVCVLPFIIIISASISDEKGLLLEGFGILPRGIDFGAYKFILRNPGQILNAYKFTVIETVSVCFIGILTMCGIAYPLSRRDFLWRRRINFFVYFTMLFSGGLVPSYLLITNYLHLKNTIWALILPSLCSGWNIFLLRTFFKEIPFTLIEAAKVDGMSEYGIFFKIILPLSKTGIATVVLFLAMGQWNEWILCMLYISDDSVTTLQYMLQRMLSDANFLSQAQKTVGSTNVGSISTLPMQMATVVLAAGPMLVAFPFFQKYFAKGVMVGAVKG